MDTRVRETWTVSPPEIEAGAGAGPVGRKAGNAIVDSRVDGRSEIHETDEGDRPSMIVGDGAAGRYQNVRAAVTLGVIAAPEKRQLVARNG